MITKKKKLFLNYLDEYYKGDISRAKKKFEEYFEILKETNKKINLFSRKMDIDEIWTKHFLDSILFIKDFNFHDESILDFGTGGGLPGIPIKILFPETKITFLDSRTKKIKAVKDFVDNLNLENCNYIDKRIENLKKYQNKKKFDIVISRAVRITKEYKSVIFYMLKKKGKVILFKSINIDDASLFKNKRIFNYKIEEIGTRNIIEIKK